MLEEISRRRILYNGIGIIGAGTGLVGKSSASAGYRGINPNFNPYDFQEVDAFVNALFSYQNKRNNYGHRPYRKGVVNALSEEQKQAFRDAIRPSVLEVATDPSDDAKNFDKESAHVTQTFVGNDPVERWGWDVTEAIGRTSHRSSVGVTSGVRYSKSATVHSYALSIDFDAYKWRAEIQWESNWESDSDEGVCYRIVTNIHKGDTVLDTHYAVDYQGTSIDVYNDHHTYDVEFQAKFYNRLPEICDPLFGLCIDLSEQFLPYIRLRGHPDGTGEVVYKDDDSLV